MRKVRRYTCENRRVLRHASIVLALGLVLLTGCGNSRTPVSSASSPQAPQGVQTLHYGPAGVGFQAPRNWRVEAQQPPLVAVVSSGPATVVVWRYPRGTPPPAGAGLARARARLVDAVRARDGTLALIRSKLVSVGSAPGIELDANEQIHGQPRRVRSTHVFLEGAELVLDEYAPPSVFHGVDHAVFSPLKRSLQLFSPIPP